MTDPNGGSVGFSADLETRELAYYVVPQDNGRFSVVLRYQGDPASDRVVVDNQTAAGAQLLRDRLQLAGLTNTDIRRLHDYGARQQRDDPNYEIIY